ncbi:MAG: N-acetyltransferase [Planctomycetota bacterium]|nr:N-acetyltransferase [Planctomycetota bacterium]
MGEQQTWTIRSEQPGDAGGIDEMLRRAFDGDNAANLVRILREEGGYDPALSFVACESDDHGRIVGHVLFSPVAIVHGDAPSPAMALGPLGVMPDRQREGIGRALVNAGLDACRTRGLAIVLVLGDPGYYARFGFTPADEARIEAPHPGWGESYQVLELLPGALKETRGRARYPDPWADA